MATNRKLLSKIKPLISFPKSHTYATPSFKPQAFTHLTPSLSLHPFHKPLSGFSSFAAAAPEADVKTRFARALELVDFSFEKISIALREAYIKGDILDADFEEDDKIAMIMAFLVQKHAHLAEGSAEWTRVTQMAERLACIAELRCAIKSLSLKMKEALVHHGARKARIDAGEARDSAAVVALLLKADACLALVDAHIMEVEAIHAEVDVCIAEKPARFEEMVELIAKLKEQRESQRKWEF